MLAPASTLRRYGFASTVRSACQVARKVGAVSAVPVLAKRRVSRSRGQYHSKTGSTAPPIR